MSTKMISKLAVTSKVNFLDEHVDNIVTENNILRSKLQSKIEALTIISKQLDKISAEKDKYKLLAEQFQLRYPYIKSSENCDKKLYNGSDRVGNNISGAQMLANTREQNKILAVEVEMLRHKLEEAEEDIKVLRKQSPHKTSEKSFSSNVNSLNFEREELVRQLEKLNKKVEQLQADLRSMLDEKEDLINERDAYKCKLHRLNHQLMVALSKRNKVNGTEGFKNGPLLDIDSLIMENRYLQERLNQALAEKELATHALTKYKSILETKHRKGAIKIGSSQTNTVVTHKQVKELLEGGANQELPITAATIKDLRALSFGLLDSLNDKSTALSHQKKANKILATRITELEQRLEDLTGTEGTSSLFPSKVLLESYCSSEVDNFEINGKPKSESDDKKSEDLEENGAKESDKDSNNCESSNSPDDSSSSDMSCSPDDGKRKNVIKMDEKEDGRIVVEHNLHEYEDENLPPELQKLVQEALENIYTEEHDK